MVRYGVHHPSLAFAPKLDLSLYYWLPRASSEISLREISLRVPSLLATFVSMFLIARLAASHPPASGLVRRLPLLSAPRIHPPGNGRKTLRTRHRRRSHSGMVPDPLDRPHTPTRRRTLLPLRRSASPHPSHLLAVLRGVSHLCPVDACLKAQARDRLRHRGNLTRTADPRHARTCETSRHARSRG